jgi:putative transposase
MKPRPLAEDPESFERSGVAKGVESRIGSPVGKAPERGKENLFMRDIESLSHVRWDCKYHVVFVPKYRKKAMYGKLRRQVGEILRDLCRQRGSGLVAGHAMTDHVHMCLRIPPKYSVAAAIGFLKGKSAVRIHRQLLGERRLVGLHFWAVGYCVSTVGLDEDMIRECVQQQEKLETGQTELAFK